MAKLSLKGICSLSHQIIDKDGKVNIHNIEMNQDDFEDCVMLTIEEAEILTRCATNEFCRLILEHAPVDLARQVEVLMYGLVKKIEQAEKSND